MDFGVVFSTKAHFNYKENRFKDDFVTTQNSMTFSLFFDLEVLIKKLCATIFLLCGFL